MKAREINFSTSPVFFSAEKQRGKWKKRLALARFTCFYEGENDQDLRENEGEEGYFTKKSVHLV